MLVCFSSHRLLTIETAGKYLLLLVFFLIALSSTAQDLFKGREALFTTPRHYIIYQCTDSLMLDGNATEASWADASWSDLFDDIEGDKQPKPIFTTRIKMLWDQKALYIYAELEEPHLWATLDKRDQIIYHDNDFEVFIDPDGNTHQYFEFEINALGTLMDLFLDKPYRNNGQALLYWDAMGVKTGVQVDGTLNDSRDTDRKWSVEMMIPFQMISSWNNVRPPENGTWWRINFSRVQWDTEYADGVYRKKINPQTNKPYAEHNWVWSPQGIINMHYPERWGYAIFSTETKGNRKTEFTLPLKEEMKQYLWLIYYKQAEYKKQYKHYAFNLKELGISSATVTVQDKRCLLSLEATSRQYIATIQCAEQKEAWQVADDGRVSVGEFTK